MPVAKTDYSAGAALALFPLLYGGALIAYVLASRAAPRYDAFGQPIPDLSGEVIGYAVVGTLVAFLTHLIAFTFLRVRLIRSWPLRALLPLQLLCVGGSLALLRVPLEPSAQML